MLKSNLRLITIPNKPFYLNDVVYDHLKTCGALGWIKLHMGSVYLEKYSRENQPSRGDLGNTYHRVEYFYGPSNLTLKIVEDTTDLFRLELE